jgi:hypothetical protein
VVDLIESYSKARQCWQSGVVLTYFFKLARYHGGVTAGKAGCLRLKASQPRHRIWTDEEGARLITVDAVHNDNLSAVKIQGAAAKRRSQDGLAARLGLRLSNSATTRKDGRAAQFSLWWGRLRIGLPDAEI